MRSPVQATRKRVIEAAIALLENVETSKLSMAGVAETAGLSRQAAYRAFPTKSELLRQVLTERIKAVGEALDPLFRQVATLEEALRVCTLQAVDIASKDMIFNKILRGSADHSIEQLMFSGSNEIRELATRLWSPLIDRARLNGEIDDDTSNELIVDWIQQIEAVLSMRDDLTLLDQQKMVEQFLIPSIIRRPKNVRSTSKPSKD